MVTEADKRRKFQSFPFIAFNPCWFHLLETTNGACCGMIQITQIYPLLELSPGRIACIRKCKQHHRIACIRKLSAREGFCRHIFLCRVCMLSAKITGAAAMKATGLRLWCYCLTIKQYSKASPPSSLRSTSFLHSSCLHLLPWLWFHAGCLLAPVIWELIFKCKHF